MYIKFEISLFNFISYDMLVDTYMKHGMIYLPCTQNLKFLCGSFQRKIKREPLHIFIKFGEVRVLIEYCSHTKFQLHPLSILGLVVI